MNKKEFLDILRQSLEGEVESSILEQSTRFYNEYISSHSDKSEEEILQEIGDPRLIAKTIIETENASNHRKSGGWNNYDGNNGSYYNDYTESNEYHSSSDNKVYHLKWYHMLVITLILILLFFVLIKIGWMLIRLFFIFLVPIIFIAILLFMFRKR